jgi:branched-chain amino acid transport system substrate-binding protein
MRGSAGYVSNIDNPLNKSFVAKFKETYGRSPDQIDAHGYIVVSMLLTALEKTGGDATFEKLQSAYREISFDTINGPVSIDSDGIAVSNRYIVEAREVDGEYVWEAFATIPQVRDPR